MNSQACDSAASAFKQLAPSDAESSQVRQLSHAYKAGTDSLEACSVQQISSWVSFAQDKVIGVSDFEALSAVADRLDQHLTLRSFLVGYAPTAADFALYGAIKSVFSLTLFLMDMIFTPNLHS